MFFVSFNLFSFNSNLFQINGPVLAFFFDYLLPHTSKDSDPLKVTSKPSNISTLARALLSYVGTYWHNTEIESVFVDELKASYTRALMLPECKVKHLRLQALFNLVTLMVESAAPISFTSQPPVQNIGFVKILIKRGLIADLARCTHSLDLSSQDLVTTVNTMLKPLEKLTNLANTQLVQPAKSLQKEQKEESSTVLDICKHFFFFFNGLHISFQFYFAPIQICVLHSLFEPVELYHINFLATAETPNIISQSTEVDNGAQASSKFIVLYFCCKRSIL